MQRIILILLLVSLLGLLTRCSSSDNKNPNYYLVVLSMDGFRWDYPDRTYTPILDSIARIGVRAKALRPAFPSKTFPNHYTMATGLYPDHHGLVNNSFFDPESGLTFTMHDSATRNNPCFYGGEPIWVTAAKQGLRTASFFWVGSELPIQGIQPIYWKQYEHGIPFEQRIDTVVAWLSLPVEKRPHLVMWYLHEPDAIGHLYGPDHPATLAKVSYLDSLLGIFCLKINRLPHARQINLIITSDHGMGAISSERVVNMKHYLNEKWIDKVIGGNPVFNIKAKEGLTDSVYRQLIQIPHVKVWPRGHVPSVLHYGTHPRTLDFTVVADSLWSISWYERSGYDYDGGTHGYDIRNPDMHAIFYACGPSFRKNHVHPVFDNVDLYPLMANLLNIVPAPVDGNLEKTSGMLR